VLAHLPDPAESVVLEELNGRAEQEAARSLAPGGHLRDGLNQATTSPGDLAEGPGQRFPGDALAAMPFVYPEAGDPPVRTRRSVFVILPPVLDAGEFRRAAVLTPSLRGTAVVQDQRGVRAAFPDPRLFRRAIADLRLAALRVITDAPASPEDPVVALDEFGEGIPRGSVQGPDRVRHLESSQVPQAAHAILNPHCFACPAWHIRPQSEYRLGVPCARNPGAGPGSGGAQSRP
jgi:hypothetical protein